MTAFVCAGFLVHAILSGNGSETTNLREQVAVIDTKGGHGLANAQRLEHRPRLFDPVVTNTTNMDDTFDVSAPAENAYPGDGEREPSILSILRKNADLAPSVSSGTDRVSVIVKPGDTLFSIARKHGLTLQDIARLNGLEDPYTILVGQTLYVAR